MATEEQNDQPTPSPKQSPKGSNFPKFNFYWIYGVVVLGIFAMVYFNPSNQPISVSYSQFDSKLLKGGDIEKIIVLRGTGIAEVTIKKDSVAKYKDFYKGKDDQLAKTGPQFKVNLPSLDKFEEARINAEKELKSTIPVEYEDRSNFLGEFFSFAGPIIILLIIWMIIARRMGGGTGVGGGGSSIFNVGKSKARMFDKESAISVSFKDVAGLAEAKVELEEIVDFLKRPEKYTNLGGKIPKGALLIGPPGTGKTLLAKAVAGEADVPFFSMAGSDFVEMFVGVGASRVRDLFKKAKEKAPCIVFIDEIDAVGRARGKNVNMGGNDERENTLNQLLTEMDGFGSNSGVIILAATNRVDVLDKALLRAGRFDRQIQVELPDIKERQEIFAVHLRPIKLEEGLKTEFLSKQTPGFSGADIANVCNEAALIAARKNKTVVEKQDFLDAVDRIVGGLEKKNKIISKDEKHAIAVHEAGHATISWLLEYAHPLLKVTIVPRGRALGAAWYLPDERQLTTAEQIFDEMCSALGGRAAEEIVFNKVSTGALNDLEKVTKQAYAMVSYFGMSSKIGNRSFYDSSGQSDYTFGKPYSEKTAEIIDEEVKLMIDSQYIRAKEILTENRDKHEALANLLLEKEVIFSEDLVKIFGKRKNIHPALEELEEIKEAQMTSESTNVEESLPSES